ncbi:hypothetical protein GCM10023156_02370 [Novipirellula rosea]|uniref:Uncharacterized protein n=1 Tax=Novipirellula rosea TaxID=1031540 RepID=A0ABP8M7B3_9BACT
MNEVIELELFNIDEELSSCFWVVIFELWLLFGDFWNAKQPTFSTSDVSEPFVSFFWMGCVSEELNTGQQPIDPASLKYFGLVTK